MRALSLFSGIGGFDLGMERAGMEVVGMVENDKFCQKVLRKHWPNVKLLGDIHDVKGDEFGSVDIVYGGPPCQPASVAGKRRGKEDSRWLWQEAYRIIRATKPAWIVLENVRGILSLEGGLVFENLLLELESYGYETRVFCLPACAINAPHRRDRVWIIAHSKGIGRKRRDSDKGETSGKDGSGTTIKPERPDSSWDITSDTEGKRKMPIQQQGQWNGSEQSDQAITNSTSKGLQGTSRHKSEQCECSRHNRNEQWDENWIEVATRLCRMDARISSALDGTLRRFGYEDANNSEAITTIDNFRREILWEMWENECKVKPTSHRSKKRGSDDSLHEMSHLGTHEKWNLGQRIKKDKELCDMWKHICTKPFKKTQNMQAELLERIRSQECNEKMASSRANRLKCLGNSVVPQIVEIIGNYIMQVEYNSHENPI